MSRYAIETIYNYSSQKSCLDLIPPLMGEDSKWGYSCSERKTIDIPPELTKNEAILLGKIMTFYFDINDNVSGPNKVHVVDKNAQVTVWGSEWEPEVLEKHSIEINNVKVGKFIPEDNRVLLDFSFCNDTYHVRRECLLKENDGEYEVTDVGLIGIWTQNPGTRTDRMLLTQAEKQQLADIINDYVREQGEEKEI